VSPDQVFHKAAVLGVMDRDHRHDPGQKIAWVSRSLHSLGMLILCGIIAVGGLPVARQTAVAIDQTVACIRLPASLLGAATCWRGSLATPEHPKRESVGWPAAVNDVVWCWPSAGNSCALHYHSLYVVLSSGTSPSLLIARYIVVCTQSDTSSAHQPRDLALSLHVRSRALLVLLCP
jgi:hypothetical protein